MINYLEKQAEKLPIVQQLSADPNWKVSPNAYEHVAPEARPHRLTVGALSGARAIGGFQRIFYNQETGEVVNVLWFGGDVAGWPGVTHGGLLATIMDETLGRCALLRFPAKTGVTANLDMKYIKPAVTNAFYVLRVALEPEGATDTKLWVNGTLETVDGTVCVRGRALFVVPKSYKLTALLKD